MGRGERAAGMERLLAYPAHLPLVHADHSHRVTPPATGTCTVQNPCRYSIALFDAKNRSTGQMMEKLGSMDVTYTKKMVFGQPKYEPPLDSVMDRVEEVLKKNMIGWDYYLRAGSAGDVSRFGGEYAVVKHPGTGTIKRVARIVRTLPPTIAFDKDEMRAYLEATEQAGAKAAVFLTNRSDASDIAYDVAKKLASLE